MSLRIRQYAYFSVRSTTMSPEAMAERIGLAPDKTLVAGSKRSDPPIPRSNAWKVVCTDNRLLVDEQVEQIVARLRPHYDALRELIADLDQSGREGASASLQIVRFFGDRAGRLDGFQHALLGWHLDSDVVRFLLDVGAEIDVDEYGQDLPWHRTIRDRFTRRESTEGPHFLPTSTPKPASIWKP